MPPCLRGESMIEQLLKLVPFRYRYWVVEAYYGNEWRVLRTRRNPTHLFGDWYGKGPLIDGPFDSQEEAAHSLAFWPRQAADYTIPDGDD
jgi:hypothetical protein